MIDDLAEYLALDGLETRIATHKEFSNHPENVSADVCALGGITPETRLLDVGCGTASFLRYLRDQNHQGQLSAIDTSASAIEAATQVADQAQIACATDLPHADGSFDVVVARHMLYHVNHPDQAIAQAHRVLTPGGTFIATVNLVDQGQSLIDVGLAALAEADIDTSAYAVIDDRVNQQNLPELVHSVFGNAQLTQRPNSFRFTTAEPAVKYLATCLTLFGIPADPELRTRAITAFHQAVTGQLNAHHGLWQPPKGYCVVTATA